MTEDEREITYWRIALACLVVSPWIAAILVRAQVAPDWHQGRFLLLLMAALPATLLLELVLTALMGKGAALRFWVVHPTVRCQHEAKEPLDVCETNVRGRLEEMGFVWQGGVSPGSAAFSKAKRPQINAFLDHAFLGAVTLRPTGFGTTIDVDLTFADTLLIETGERAKLRALADYFCLKSSDKVFRGVSLLLYCSLSLAFMTVLASALMRTLPELARAWLFPASAATFGFLAFAVGYMLRDRQHLYGYRLAAAAILLAALPWAGWLLRVLRI